MNIFHFGLSRGSKLGHVIACCCGESGACRLVDVGTRVEQLSTQSSKWHMRVATKYMWLMHEAACCAAWLWAGDHVTVVVM